MTERGNNFNDPDPVTGRKVTPAKKTYSERANPYSRRASDPARSKHYWSKAFDQYFLYLEVYLSESGTLKGCPPILPSFTRD